ncbi:acyl-CoA synthetase (AMP-forming)/AMP-acid ligase II [Amycolatopsis bartoniae]|uniref:O-succinylbenzoate--CoA ligase n=1 Tax=Amycolatopsis bartoniae TaxID=941986 RepID=A0A8H9IPR8_9PSEU|nr:class I adenylate-forming enzyme family protein [Amycolatopsis bartoniae]MBB2939907.1 acyl-CoA synthetase (AMP-forming)/AMP-acid ligase II [Amycolatopsis bartoniae]TVT08307.1 acyl--CoA ligase [Amycolatopsis bartoniae]GHF35747.1 o-succinylbenzoate--CoA ligase [Amycolatopsis bartoniae]
MGWAALANLVRDRGEQRPDGVAVYTPSGDRTTWGELATASSAVTAACLSAAGRPARIGVWIPNGPLFGAGLFGAWQSGATAAVISSLASPAEAVRLAGAAGVDVVVTTSNRAAHFPDLPVVAVDSLGTAEEPATVDPAAEALLLFTSGTTGVPKGIVHRGEALVSSIDGMLTSSGIEPGPRSLADEDRRPNVALTPLSHTSGLMGLLFAWWAGKPVVVFERFDAASLDAVVAEHKVRTLRLVPAMVFDLVHAPAQVRLAGVRYATVGSAALSRSLAARFEERYGFPLLSNYGQTEAMGGIAAERLEDVRAGRRPPGSVGRALPGVHIRILDTATGREAAAGEVGEITVSSPQVMRRYAGDEAAPVDPDGFLHTGDLGSVDEDGILSVAGRVKDLIVSGGFNIYPAEVEDVLEHAPGVAAAAVAGVPDDRLGERMLAVVVPSGESVPEPGALHAWVRDRLAPYKSPRGYLALPELPRTQHGKLDRRALAKLVADRAGEFVIPAKAPTESKEMPR